METITETELTINKIPDGDIRQLLAPSLQTDSQNGRDVDGGVDETSIRYQWQYYNTDESEWMNIVGAIAKTYGISEATTSGIIYRVEITYTDGQGYTTQPLSQQITYYNIDEDNNGLIDILALQQNLWIISR